MDFDFFTRLAFGLIGMASIAFFAYQAVQLIFPDERLVAAQARLGVESAARQFRHWSLRVFAPFVRTILPRIQQIRMPFYRQKMKKHFVAAGVDDQFDADEFVGYKITGALVFCFLTPVFLSQFGMSPGLNSMAVGMLFGFFLPDIALRQARGTRERSIIRELPAVMDLMTLSVEAGMDFVAAIARVIEFQKEGPLKEEFARMLKEIQLGTTRSDAIRNMADRIQIPQVSSFASILVQADQMGSPIGPVLRAQSDVLRTQRFQRAEREGARAAQKILLPLVVCILPAVFIVILGPVICDIVYNQPWFKNMFGGGG